VGGSSDKFYREAVETVYSSKEWVCEGNNDLNKLLGRLKVGGEANRKDLSALVDLCVQDKESRDKLVSRVKLNRDFLSVYPQIYCSVISGLIEKEELKHVVDFHKKFFVPDKAYSRDVLLAVLKLGLPKSFNSLRCMERLYKITPRGAIGDIFDELVPWLVLSRVEPRLASNFVLLLIKHGDFPHNSYDAMEKVLRDNPSCIRRLICVILPASFKNGHAVPYKTLKKLIKMSSELLPNSVHHIKCAMLEKTEDGRFFKDAVDARIWGKLIQYHVQTPVATIIQNLESMGVDTTSEYIQEGCAMRAGKISAFDSVVKNSKSRFQPKVWGHGVYLHTRRNPKEGRTIYSKWKEHYDSPHLTYGYLKGLYYSRQYRPLLDFHESLDIQEQGVQSWNYYLSTAAASKRANKVVWAIDRMLDRNILIKPRQVSDSIICLLEHGRIARSPRNCHVSRPLQGVSSKIAHPAQYEPFDIKHIETLINRLESHGYVYPGQSLDQLFQALDNVRLSKHELHGFLFCIAKSWVNVASHTWDDGTSGELVIFLNSFNPVNVFSPHHVNKLVFLGFKTSPKRPWKIIHLIHRIRNLGIVIEKDDIMNAFMDMTNQLYGHRPLTGEMKRIREQLDPDLSPSEAVSKINHAWRHYAQK
jgi:hypothetical protein